MPKRFKRRLDTPIKLVKIEGLDQIPLNPDGTVVYGVYIIRYVWNYDGIRIVKPRTLEFRPPDNRIEFRRNGALLRKTEPINIISSQSTNPYSPTFYSSIDTSLPSDITAHYVERDINDNITLEIDITNTVTVNTTAVENSVVSNKLRQGEYLFFYEVEYDNGTTVYNKSVSRSIVSVTHQVVPEEPLYEFAWENLPLPTINKDVGDAFPSLAEMTDIIPIGVLTEIATGNTIRFATTHVTPTEPVGGVTDSSTFLISFRTNNLLSGSGADTGITDLVFNTYAVPQVRTRSIQYNLETQNPQPLPFEITFSPETLDDIVFQDFESGSNPVPLSFENGGLFPSEAALLSGVTATYVDDNSVQQPLTVTLTRPTGSLYNNDIRNFFFNNGEVKMHIPRSWPVVYEATAPDGTTKTLTRDVIIEDTISPVFSPVVPTTMEKGTDYNAWTNREFFGYDYPRYSFLYPAPRSGVVITTNITEQQFVALDHGDTFITNYTSVDNSGNTTLVAQSTTVQDTTAPRVTFGTTLTFLIGDNPTDEQLKVGVQTEDASEPLTITVDDTAVNYSTQGFYLASYTVSDPHGNSTVASRNVFVKDNTAPATPPAGPNPVACPQTPGVPNIELDGTEVIANLTDAFWTDGLYAAQGNEDITFNIVVSQNSIDALPVTAQGTLDYDNDSDGFVDVEVTPLYINYEIQDEDGNPIICTTRYIETIDTLAPTIYDVPNPILVYKTPNDPVTQQSTTTPNDIILEIVSQINVIDNVDGTGFVTATLEGIGQGDINTGDDIVRTLRFTDSSGNESRYVTTIQFSDNQHPTLTLLGDNPLTLTSSLLPVDPGATATDPEDGALSVTSYWTQTLGTEAREGTYNVNYTATDSAGVLVQDTRTVVVPYFTPTLTLLGDNPYDFFVNPGDQDDPFAESYSVRDGDITANIVSDWDTYINTSMSGGTYNITYSITDSAGSTVTDTREVTYTPLDGYLEEVPFLYPTSGSIHNFTNLDSDTAMPLGNYYTNQRARVQVTGSYLPATTRDFTISLWIHPSDTSTGGNFIDSNNLLGTSHSAMMTLAGGASAGSFSPGTANVSFSQNEFFGVGYRARWLHLVMTVSSTGELKVYRDGVLTVNRTFTPTHDLDLSGDFTMTSAYRARVDSVDFINYVLPPEDTLDLYNAGQGNRFLTYYSENPRITLLGDNPMTITDLSTVTDPGATATDLQDGDLTNSITSDWDSYIDSNTVNGTYTITYTVTDSDGNTRSETREVIVDICEITSPTLYFEGSSTDAQVGSNSVSFSSGASITTSNGKNDSSSFYFGTTETNEALTLSTGVNLNRTYTFSVWFYNKRSSGNLSLVKQGTSAGSERPIMVGSPSNALGANIGGIPYLVYVMDSYDNLQEWTHLAAVANGSTTTFYINGQSVGGANAASNASFDTIGGNISGNQTFAEALDEFAYWDSALQPCEIEKIYNLSTKLVPSITITLLGDNPMTITDLSTVTDPGATAVDSEGVDITSSITSDWDSYIDSNTINGTYAITYTATDSDSNVKTITRAVIVALQANNVYGQPLEEISTTTLVGSPTLSNGVLTIGTNQGAYSDSAYLYTDRHTILGWFKTSKTGRASIISSIKFFGGSGGLWLMIKPNTNGLTLEVRIYETNSRDVTLTNSVNDGNWHHFAITWEEGGQHNVYIDGTNVDSQAAANHNGANAGAFWLGSFRSQNSDTPHTSNSLEGEIDGYYVLNEILSQCQIQNVYILGHGNITSTPSESIPVSDLYFDGTSTAPLNSINNIALGGATLSTTNGKYDSNSFSFGTSGNKAPITLTTPIDLSTGVYTFSLWFYNVRSGTDWKSVFRRTSGASPVNTAQYPIVIPPNGELSLLTESLANGGSFGSTGYDMSGFVNNQSWNHLAVVADGTNSTFYINGQQAGNVVNEVITTSVGEIGAYGGNNTQVFAEGLDEIAYWDIALGSCHIKKIYESSSKLSEATINNLEESRLATLYGNASINNGTLTLDGDGDYATYDGEFKWTDKFSISVWFKTQGSPTDVMVICSNHDAGGVGPNGNVFSLDTNGTLRIKTQDSGTGTTGDALGLGSNLDDNNWHHLVVTWQASTTNGRNIYIDGQLVHQNNTGASNTWKTTPQSLLYIGGIWNGVTNSFTESGWWDGEIDDFRLLRKILSPTEVQEIYCKDTTLTTASNYWDGSSTIAQIGSDALNIRGGTASATGGKYAAVLDFSGTENASITPSSAFDFSGDATLSFWMKEPDTTKVSSTGANHDYWWQVLRSDQGSGNNYAAFSFDNRNPTYTGNAQGSLTFFYNSSQAQNINYNISSLQDGQWHHVAFVKSGTSIDVYVDNVVIGTATNVPAGILFDQINGWSGTTVRSKFANYISDLAYWDSALDPCEIFKIYFSTVKLNDIE